MADDHSQNPSLWHQDGTPVLASFSADPSAPFQPPRVHQAGQQVSFPTVSHYAQAPQQQPAVGSQASYSSLLNSPLTPSPGGGGSFIEQQQALMVQQQQQKHLMLQQLQVQQQQKEVEQQRKELAAQAAEQQRVAAQQLHILSQAPGTLAGQGAQAPANAADAAAPDKPKPAEWTHDTFMTLILVKAEEHKKLADPNCSNQYKHQRAKVRWNLIAAEVSVRTR